MQHLSQDTKKLTHFEYSTIPPQQRASIQRITLEIKDSLRKTVQTVWETGKKLAEVRSQIETCQFNLWLKTEFDWSRRTAYNFINVYEAFPEFSSANFAQLNISISALYLLAAPSMHQATRQNLINKALSGEHISHKVIQRVIKEAKSQPVDDARLVLMVPEEIVTEGNLTTNFQQSETESPMLEDCNSVAKLKKSEFGLIAPTFVPEDSDSVISDLRPAWNKIEKDFSLFWGDTASLRFIEQLPQDAFILAIPSNKWRHNWLLSKSRNFIILHQPTIKEDLLEKLLSTFSADRKAVIFPWLPDWKMIKLALELNIKVYAGDPELKQCENVVSRLGVNIAKSMK
jgi:Protein of unknown function (DUF3102)